MKILLTSPTYPPFNSGLGNAVQQQAFALAKSGCSVVVATGGQRRGQRRDSLSGALIEEFAVHGADSILQPIGGDADGYVRFVTESQFDIVLMNAWQTWSTDLCLRNLDKISARKFVYSHCVSTNTLLRPQPIRSLLRYLAWRPYWWKLPARMQKLDGMIFLSAAGCDSRFDDLALAKRLGLDCAVVPNALSVAALTALEESWPSSMRRQLIAVGSYDWQKGHDFVLRAYAQSTAKNKIPLKIFGQHYSSYTDTLRSLANQLGLHDDFVSFHEGVSDSALLVEYKKSHLLLSGSHTECQPLVLLDAMAAGTPFIARAAGCIPALPGGASVLTEQSAAQAIDRLLCDQVEWQRLSKVGQTEANEKYHPAVVGEHLRAVLLGKKKK